MSTWLTSDDKDNEECKKPDTSNMQGLDNDKPIPRGELNETITFDSERHINTLEHQPSGEVVKEKSDLRRLHDEDLRSRVAEKESGEQHISDDNVRVEHRTSSIAEYDPVVHPDSKIGRIHLSIRYDNERSKLIVQMLDGQGLIRPGQLHSPEMHLAFILIGPDVDDDMEKHSRVVVENAAISWKEPMSFCITYKNVIKLNLYVNVENKTDPVAPREREISIPLDNLGSHGEEINQWYDLQFVQSSY